VTGYLITNLAANLLPLAPAAENAWWYQYYFATERGVLGLTEHASDLGEFIWKFNSPTWNFTTETYNQTAAAFSNPDFVPIIIGNYRWRLSLYPAEAQYATIENQLQQAPGIAVPTITIDGKYDPFTPAGDGSAYRAKFTGKYDHRVLTLATTCPRKTRAASPGPSSTPVTSRKARAPARASWGALAGARSPRHHSEPCRNCRVSSATRSGSSSRAKWPASRRWILASGTSRR
jgi:hypothetical protein